MFGGRSIEGGRVIKIVVKLRIWGGDKCQDTEGLGQRVAGDNWEVEVLSMGGCIVDNFDIGVWRKGKDKAYYGWGVVERVVSTRIGLGTICPDIISNE